MPKLQEPVGRVYNGRVYKRRSFWVDVDKNGPIHPEHGQCWQWIGCVGTRGYGQCYDGRNKPPCRAHRMSWRLKYGNLEDKDLVLHKCDNPLCVNPEHLFIGTHQDNMKDKVAKGRGNPPVGERHGQAKITEDSVREIKSLYKAKVSQGSLAKRFGVCQQQISRIVTGKRWRHI